MRARWATLWEVPQAITFCIANAVNSALDHRIFNYPTTRIMRAEDEEGNAAAYLPVHTGAILESLGWAENLDASHKVLAAVTAADEIEREAWLLGYREVFFICSDERTDDFCQRHLGYEKVSVMRKRLL